MLFKVYTKDIDTRERVQIANFSFDSGKYIFSYVKNIKDIINNSNVSLFGNFIDLDKPYESTELFLSINNRIPQNGRRKSYCEENKLEALISELELLKHTFGVLETDHFEFIPPIDFTKNNSIEFKIAGECYHEYKNNLTDIKINQKCTLEIEPDNKVDKYAVKINIENKLLAYVPKFFSEDISKLLNEGRKFNCVISKIQERSYKRGLRFLIKIDF